MKDPSKKNSVEKTTVKTLAHYSDNDSFEKLRKPKIQNKSEIHKSKGG